MQWGAWSSVGMAVSHNLLPRIARSGLGVLTPAAGMSALDGLLCANLSAAQVTISPFNWTTLMRGAKRVLPIFLEFEHHLLRGAGVLNKGMTKHRPVHTQLDV